MAQQDDRLAQNATPSAPMPGDPYAKPAGQLSLTQIKALIPEHIGAWKRTVFSVPIKRRPNESGQSVVSTYRHGKATATLTVTDIGAPDAASAASQWTGAPTEHSTATGTEKIYKDGTHTVREEFRSSKHQREVTLILTSGVVIAAMSADAGVEMAELKKLAEGVDLAQAEAIARPAK